MKRVLFFAAALALVSGALEARSFNEKLRDECIYILGDHDNGRYDEEAHGYSLGVISGLKDGIPASMQSQNAQASLGALSNYACKKALRDRSSRPFVFKYRKAALDVMRKKSK